MPEKGHIPVERTLFENERILLEWLLARPSSDVSGSDLSKYKSQVDKTSRRSQVWMWLPDRRFCTWVGSKIRSVRNCGRSGRKIAEGVSVGVILHAREGELSELEVYSTQGLDTSFTLPIPDSLEHYE